MHSGISACTSKTSVVQKSNIILVTRHSILSTNCPKKVWSEFLERAEREQREKEQRVERKHRES